MNQSHPILRSAGFLSFKQTKRPLTLILLLSTNLLFAQDALHIDRSGNVGIGTDTPTAKLDVNGNAKISGNLGASTLSGTLTGDVTGNLTGNVTGTIDGASTGDLLLQTNSSGNVGIGIKMPTAKLEVKGRIKD